MNAELRNNFENVTTKLNNKSNQLEVVTKGLQNATKVLLTLTFNLESQQKHLRNLSSHFHSRISYLTGITETMSSKAENLEESFDNVSTTRTFEEYATSISSGANKFLRKSQHSFELKEKL